MGSGYTAFLGIPKYRKFNGKRYERAYTRATRREADKAAKALREIGTSARVVKYDTKYVVYARG